MVPPRELGRGKLRRIVRPDGDYYWEFDYADETGTRRKKRLGRNRAVALQRATKIIRDRDLVASGLGATVGVQRPWREVLPEYLAALEMRAKPEYVKRADREIARVLTDIRAVKLADVQLAKVVAWQQRQAGTVAPKTVNGYVNRVRTFLKWCVGRQIIAASPLAVVEAVSGSERNPRRALRESEVGRLLTAAHRMDREAEEYRQAERTVASGTKGKAWQERERLVPVPRTLTLRFLIKVGARWGAATQITWADVSNEDREILIRGEIVKTGRERAFPVDDELLDLLDDLRSAAYRATGRVPAASDTVLLSPMGLPWTKGGSGNFRRWLYEALERAGIPRIDTRGRRVTVHSMRHTFATRLLRKGVPLIKVMYLGGWSTARTLESIYAHIMAEDAREDVASVPLPSVEVPASAGSKVEVLHMGDASRKLMGRAKVMLVKALRSPLNNMRLPKSAALLTAVSQVRALLGEPSRFELSDLAPRRRWLERVRAAKNAERQKASIETPEAGSLSAERGDGLGGRTPRAGGAGA